MRLVPTRPDTGFIAVSVNGNEYFVLLRPNGLISRLCEEYPIETQTMEVLLDREGEGAIILLPVTAVHGLELCDPGHICDLDLRRLVLSHYLEAQLPTPNEPELDFPFLAATGVRTPGPSTAG